jgi:hypothetical protein
VGEKIKLGNRKVACESGLDSTGLGRGPIADFCGNDYEIYGIVRTGFVWPAERVSKKICAVWDQFYATL